MNFCFCSDFFLAFVVESNLRGYSLTLVVESNIRRFALVVESNIRRFALIVKSDIRGLGLCVTRVQPHVSLIDFSVVCLIL